MGARGWKWEIDAPEPETGHSLQSRRSPPTGHPFPSPDPDDIGGMRKLFAAATALLLLGATTPWLVLHGSPQGPVIAIEAPSTLDPGRVSSQSDLRLVDCLFEPLLRLDPETLAPREALAESWAWSSDAQTFALDVRAGARWSDGSPVTAQQARAGILRHRQGGALGGLGQLLDGVVGVEVADGNRLLLRCAHPMPWLPAVLACPAFVPLHPSQATDADLAGLARRWSDPLRIIGNGPMRVTSHLPRHHYDLEPNPAYRGPWNAVGSLRLLVVGSPEAALRLQLAGQVDALLRLSADTLGDLRRAGVPGLQTAQALDTFFFRVRCQDRPGRPAQATDPRVRRALALALDRTGTARDLLGGASPAVGLVPPALRQAAGMPPPVAPAGDPGLLLAAAEDTFGSRTSWPPFELICGDDSPERATASEHLADRWRRDLGLAFRVLRLPRSELRRRTAALDYDLALGSWTADFPDPLNFLEVFRSGEGANRCGWADPEYDRLVALGRSAIGSDRATALGRAEERLLAEAPILPLIHSTCAFLVRPGLQGILANPLEQVRFGAVGWPSPTAR